MNGTLNSCSGGNQSLLIGGSALNSGIDTDTVQISEIRIWEGRYTAAQVLEAYEAGRRGGSPKPVVDNSDCHWILPGSSWLDLGSNVVPSLNAMLDSDINTKSDQTTGSFIIDLLSEHTVFRAKIVFYYCDCPDSGALILYSSLDGIRWIEAARPRLEVTSGHNEIVIEIQAVARGRYFKMETTPIAKSRRLSI